MMSEYQKHTAFLGELIQYADLAAHGPLKAKLTQAQHDERCVWRAVELMVFLSALVIAGLGYVSVFLEHFPPDTSHFIFRWFCELGLASLLSLLFFMALWVFYRMELNRQREACRHLAMKFLESRLDRAFTDFEARTIPEQEISPGLLQRQNP